MATITIDFEFSDGSTDSADFEATGGLVADITSYQDDLVDELNEDSDEEIECTGYEVSDWDTDHDGQQSPNDFADLDEWADYCDLVDQHGEAYILRFADIGDHDFEDEYNGCWASAEEFVKNFIEGCYEIPCFFDHYIDWEKVTRDFMMDYSEYTGYDGVHIFRD